MTHGPPRRLAALLLLALACAGARPAGGQFTLQELGLEHDAALRRTLLALATDPSLTSLACATSPYLATLAIPTPGLYKFRVKAIGAYGDFSLCEPRGAAPR